VAREATFLVVDDVPMFRDLGTLFLSRYGRVITATRGEEALEIVRRERPDVVVLDLHLPDLPGELVCREIRTAPATADTAVVVLAGGDAEEHARAVRAGASDVLAKPIARLTLVESVQRFAEGGWPRGLPRVALDAPVRVRAARAERWLTARNVSRGGLFLEGDGVPAESGEVTLEFALPDGPRRLAATARIVWRRVLGADVTGAGLRFVALDRESARRLDAFVHEHFVPAAAPPAAAGGTRA
jgi:uncharacterized protein (TIGR02266 family)